MSSDREQLDGVGVWREWRLLDDSHEAKREVMELAASELHTGQAADAGKLVVRVGERVLTTRDAG